MIKPPNTALRHAILGPEGTQSMMGVVVHDPKGPTTLWTRQLVRGEMSRDSFTRRAGSGRVHTSSRTEKRSKPHLLPLSKVVRMSFPFYTMESDA